ncbi:hypothetical protein PM082_009140 [Marasmius tenuissimus]|nr:hypothetical protein PM082_009140 [Marasmius tenuissimus]
MPYTTTNTMEVATNTEQPFGTCTHRHDNSISSLPATLIPLLYTHLSDNDSPSTDAQPVSSADDDLRRKFPHFLRRITPPPWFISLEQIHPPSPTTLSSTGNATHSPLNSDFSHLHQHRSTTTPPSSRCESVENNYPTRNANDSLLPTLNSYLHRKDSDPSVNATEVEDDPGVAPAIKKQLRSLVFVRF